MVEELDGVEDLYCVSADVVCKYAYSLHIIGRADALRYYALALEKGFDGFRARYHRRILYHSLGRGHEALEDLAQAADIHPVHQEVAEILQEIRNRMQDRPTSDLPRNPDP